MMNQENQKIEYIDENGHRILPAGFEVKKAERIMGNFLNYHSLRHTTFSEVASSLILSGTGYDGGTGTEHYQFHFKNGYGASVIRGPHSYGGPQGLYELAVLRKCRKYWEITYKTPITSDVLGNLEVDDVVKALEDIRHLADDYD